MNKIIMKNSSILIVFITLSLFILSYFDVYNEFWDQENIVTFNEERDGKQAANIFDDPNIIDETFIPTFDNISALTGMQDLQKYLYTIDENAYVMDGEINLERFANMDLAVDLLGEAPKVLIFHTHSQEYFIDSTEGKQDDSIVGVGRILAQILVEKYNIPVVHDVGQYDVVDGKIERGSSYENMEPAITRILQKYPSIEVIIDLHRDGVPDNIHLVTEINGKPTAKLMFFNGITRLNNNGEPKELPSLVNPYIDENLALSLQLQLTANELYPTLTRKIYIKAYRYSLHMLPRSMLVEVGANTNTLQEAKNSMEPLAEIIVKVLSK